MVSVSSEKTIINYLRQAQNKNKMEDDLKKMKMEDNLNFLTLEDDLNF